MYSPLSMRFYLAFGDQKRSTKKVKMLKYLWATITVTMETTIMFEREYKY